MFICEERFLILRANFPSWAAAAARSNRTGAAIGQTTTRRAKFPDSGQLWCHRHIYPQSLLPTHAIWAVCCLSVTLYFAPQQPQCSECGDRSLPGGDENSLVLD
ncbi:MAG TPA: hypothetical protein IGS52_12640 [Oscillatoriaceae cyanobacterium M33_DOE_052]|uniref:Uncharacterized protein n=1 Tax=Planktothricoides sp. SpSt-374 TaxID=2282167 RepID=A0A7C3VR40_9CYAN|nr:hypothetical protein [Oscillatoriaceae cyanobacterium M33_DOE_052]